GAEAEGGVLGELAEDDGGERLGAEVAAGDGSAVGGQAHAALDEGRHTVGLFEGDVEGGLADDGGVAVEVDGAGCEHFAVAVGQRDGLATVVQGGDGGEGGAQVDADEASHDGVLSAGSGDGASITIAAAPSGCNGVTDARLAPHRRCA